MRALILGGVCLAVGTLPAVAEPVALAQDDLGAVTAGVLNVESPLVEVGGFEIEVNNAIGTPNVGFILQFSNIVNLLNEESTDTSVDFGVGLDQAGIVLLDN